MKFHACSSIVIGAWLILAALNPGCASSAVNFEKTIILDGALNRPGVYIVRLSNKSCLLDVADAAGGIDERHDFSFALVFSSDDANRQKTIAKITGNQMRESFKKLRIDMQSCARISFYYRMPL